ncbi:MAG: hypothetical protein ABI831_25060, partial [Betaproteobacteria bacterium]
MSGQLSIAARSAAHQESTDAAIADWLLRGPAQARTGANAGGVAGCIAVSGSPLYVYPEIAGYYLQWLAWRTQR